MPNGQFMYPNIGWEWQLMSMMGRVVIWRVHDDQRWALEKLAKVLALSLESSSLKSSISSVCCLARSNSLRLMAIC